MRSLRLAAVAVVLVLAVPGSVGRAAGVRQQAPTGQEASCDPPSAASYADVVPTSTLLPKVAWAVCHRVMLDHLGPPRRFAPAEPTTRGDLVRAIWVLVGKPDPVAPGRAFPDVPLTSRARRALDWASSADVVEGDPSGTFRPSGAATRANVVTWAHRAVAQGHVPAGAPEVVVTDVLVGSERERAAQWAVASGLLALREGGRLDPRGAATRGLVTKVLWRAAGAPGAWAPVVAGAALLHSAMGWWDVAAWDGTGATLPDRSGGGHPLALVEGDVGPPVVLGRDGAPEPWLFHPGWDDMILDTPDPAGFPTGSFELRLDADLRRELRTNGSSENVVLHQGGANDDAGLAISFRASDGAATVWWSPDGSSWEHLTVGAPDIGTGPGRRGLRFVADDGLGGHRLELYEQPKGVDPAHFDAPFEDEVWVPVDDATAPGTVTIHDSASEVAMSSGHDQVPAGNLATGWGRIRRLRLTTPTATVLDVDAAAIGLPLSWHRSGPIPGPQPCWCLPGDTAGPAKDGAFVDRAGATWTIHNWQTGSSPIVLVDQPAVLVGNDARLTTEPTTAFQPTGEGLSVAMSYRWTRAGISGAYLFGNRENTLDQQRPGWAALATGNLCCGPAFGVSDGQSSVFARSPAAPDGVVTTAIGVYDRVGRSVRSYSDGRPGAAEEAPAGAATPGPAPFSIGAAATGTKNYGGFEFFVAAVFARPLSPDEVGAVDAYLRAPDRPIDVEVPAPLRFA